MLPVLVMLTWGGPLQTSPDPLLDRRETARLVRASEDRMAATHDAGAAAAAVTPTWVDDPGNPMIGKRCTLRLRLEGLQLGPQQANNAPAPAVLHTTLKGSLSRVFDLQDLDPELADELDQALAEVELLDRQLDDVRDELRYLQRRNQPRRSVGRVTYVYERCRRCGHHGTCHCGHQPHWHQPTCHRPHCDHTRCGVYDSWHHGPHCGSYCSCRRSWSDQRRLQDRRRMYTLRSEIESSRSARDELKGLIGQARREVREAIRDARHTVLLQTPPNWTSPSKMPRNMTATVRITRVRWDASAPLPTLLMEGELLD